MLTSLGVGVGVDVPKIITRAVSTRLGVKVSGVRFDGLNVDVGLGSAVDVNVPVGKTKPPLPPCPPLEEGGGTGVFVGAGGRGVLVGTGVSDGVTPGGSVALGVLVRVLVLSEVEVGEGVSDGVTPGASVSVNIGVRVSVAVKVGVNVAVGIGVPVSVGKGVKVSVGIGVFVATGGGGET